MQAAKRGPETIPTDPQNLKVNDLHSRTGKAIYLQAKLRPLTMKHGNIIVQLEPG